MRPQASTGRPGSGARNDPNPRIREIDMALTQEQALRAYATALNRLDASVLLPLLADDFHYASQRVFAEITSKAEFAAYFIPKLDTVRRSGQRVWAEMGHLDREIPGPCVVVAQGEKETLVGLVLAKVAGDRIQRLDMCIVPSPHSARRLGDYPGLLEAVPLIDAQGNGSGDDRY
jgi:hypothetical protein